MNEDGWTKVGLLVGGWLLGMLSPAIVETIRRARDLKPMQQSLADELHEFRFTTACVSSVLRTHLGTGDREFWEWFKLVTDDYHGVMDAERFRKAAGVYVELSDEQLSAISEHQAGAEASGLHMRSLAVVGLDARLPSLWMFPKRSQTELLRLLGDVSIFNGEPPRILRRLHSLRGLSHEEVEQVFT
jgi:hypothetical protein